MIKRLPAILAGKMHYNTQRHNSKYKQSNSIYKHGSVVLPFIRQSWIWFQTYEFSFKFCYVFCHVMFAYLLKLYYKIESLIETILLDHDFYNAYISFCSIILKPFRSFCNKSLKFQPRINAGLSLGVILFSCLTVQNAYAKKCTGEFVNPISDINWSCLFPISIGRFEIVGSKHYDTENPASPICVCPRNVGGVMVPVPGIVGGFWEPARMVDVSAEPYCFVNMGGLEINMGFERSQGSRPKSSSSQMSRWYVHYYAYPILHLLELFTDFICLEKASFDVLWISEIDPTGMDDELAMILHPEGFLFNSLIAQTACSADCTSSSLGKGMPIDSLYWCAGCQGSMFPMNGSVNAHIGGVQASVNAAEKMTFKMHRQGMTHECSSDDVNEICSKRLALQMKKSHYRYQMVNPDTASCAPFGKSTTFFESNKERPIVGEDFGHLIWRKRTCCIF